MHAVKTMSVSLQNKLGDTPLHSAAWKGHAPAVELLLAKGDKGRFFGISDKGGEIFFSVFSQIMPCIVFPDNSITRKITLQTNIIGAYI